MIKNYLTITCNNLQNNKIYSFLNITGLAIGLASFLLITLYIMDELSYDRYNDKADRIYRINSDIKLGGGELHMPVTSDMMGQLLIKDYPAIEQYTRIYNSNGSKMIKKDKVFIIEDHVAHVDSTFFDVFTLPAIAGNTHTALNEPNTVVITESTAKKYFGSTDVVGKSIETNDDKNPIYKITAVIKDIPSNSHFQFDFMFSMKNAGYEWGQLTSHNFHTYLLLKKGADYKQLEKNFDQYIDHYVLPSVRQFIQIKSMDEFKKAGNRLDYSLIPLTKIHLHSDRSFELSPSGNIQYVYIFGAVALFILLIACINFMNLTTARSAGRAKEVGIRKVLGTERRFLIFQFLTESTLMVIFSLILAIVIAYLVLPLFNDVASKSMVLGSLFSPYILPLLIALPFVVGLLAGSYPAFFLSGFRPIEVLKGKWKMGSKKGGSLRSLLVIFQFSTTIILIIGTLVIYRQLHFIQTKNLGYNKDQVVIFNNAGVLNENLNAYKTELLKYPGVLHATVSNFLPVEGTSRSDQSFSKSLPMTATNGFDMQTWYVDDECIKTLGMQILNGRDFRKSAVSDSGSVIINETCARVLGYKNPVGMQIFDSDNKKKTESFTIIGVVKDFNYESLKQPVAPLCLFLSKGSATISFRIEPGAMNGFLAKSETLWKQFSPSMPFNYQFMDDAFSQMYQSEQRVGKIEIGRASCRERV